MIDNSFMERLEQHECEQLEQDQALKIPSNNSLILISIDEEESIFECFPTSECQIGACEIPIYRLHFTTTSN